ncbi:MAG: class I SAM-dependent RNA methyltransferase [Clostridia bacterium]
MYDLFIPSASGVESVVKRELERLGYPNAKADNGRIKLVGEQEDIARLNMCLRSGERVLIKLAEFNAQTFDQVYDNVYAFCWQDILPVDARILVYGKSINSKLFAIKSLTSIVKKAIINKLYDCYKCNLNETGSRYKIEIALLGDNAVITLDTTGEGLHKRGYRTLSHQAPMKETLANALIDFSIYNPDKTLVDLFCGSGTIPIEACLRALNIAPGLYRDYDYRHWHTFDNKSYDLAKEEAQDKQTLDRRVDISGYDISSEAIDISRYHAKQAGVDKYINWQVAPMNKFTSDIRFGVLVSNLPYGQRVGEVEDIIQINKDLGKLYSRLPDWNFYLFTSDQNFERQFGKRADKVRKLYNANIQCAYYSYPSKVKPIKIAKND